MKEGKDHIGIGVGGIIFNGEGKVLLSKRGPKAANESGTWEFPGGTVEYGELLVDALKREIREEFGIEIDVERLADLCDHILPEEGQHWVAPAYVCHLISGEPKIKEPGVMEEVAWFTLQEVGTMPLSKASQHNYEALRRLDD